MTGGSFFARQMLAKKKLFSGRRVVHSFSRSKSSRPEPEARQEENGQGEGRVPHTEGDRQPDQGQRPPETPMVRADAPLRCTSDASPVALLSTPWPLMREGAELRAWSAGTARCATSSAATRTASRCALVSQLLPLRASLCEPPLAFWLADSALRLSAWTLCCDVC